MLVFLFAAIRRNQEEQRALPYSAILSLTVFTANEPGQVHNWPERLIDFVVHTNGGTTKAFLSDPGASDAGIRIERLGGARSLDFRVLSDDESFEIGVWLKEPGEVDLAFSLAPRGRSPATELAEVPLNDENVFFAERSIPPAYFAEP